MTEDPGRYRWHLRAGSKGVTSTVTTRRHQYVVGDVVTFDEEHPQVTALEYLLGAVAGELVAGLRAFGTRQRLDIDTIEALVEGELKDPLAYLGVMGAAGEVGLGPITVKVFVSSLEEPPILESLLAEVIAHSPITRTLREAVEVAVVLKVVL